MTTSIEKPSDSLSPGSTPTASRRRGTVDSGRRPGGGVVLFWIGIIGTLAGVGQRLGTPLPYYCGEWMLILLFLGTGIAGASLTWRDDHPRTGWAPQQAGRRFQSVVLYTRDGCHLCDEVHELLVVYAEYLPEVVCIDIDSDPDLPEQFGLSIPVVEMDGVVRFKGRVSEVMLRRLIDGTPPVCD
ncbi:MAG: glutaredoxin family protein [Planctomycetaceae bacterium]